MAANWQILFQWWAVGLGVGVATFFIAFGLSHPWRIWKAAAGEGGGYDR